MEIDESDILKLDVKFNRMMDAIETVKDKQDAMAEDIGKIKEAVYNPDQGLYARLRELENWKKTHSKLMWMMVSSMIGLVSAAIFTNIIN
jgi:seryl-tRNA synthetase